ncbi:MAG: hypothetical protein WCJ09_02270 [Planctomycetota bacterium]
MKQGFAPAIRLLNRLTYPRKFGLIALLFGLPLGLAMFFLVSELNHRVAFSAKEQLGTEYLRPLQRFSADLRERRGQILESCESEECSPGFESGRHSFAR